MWVFMFSFKSVHLVIWMAMLNPVSFEIGLQSSGGIFQFQTLQWNSNTIETST